MLHGPDREARTPAEAYVGNVPANTRLGIPPLNLNDGPQVGIPKKPLVCIHTAVCVGVYEGWFKFRDGPRASARTSSRARRRPGPPAPPAPGRGAT
jgi:hypothetical protein